MLMILASFAITVYYDNDVFSSLCLTVSSTELPFGWEEAHDPVLGCYYINHVKRKSP